MDTTGEIVFESFRLQTSQGSTSSETHSSLLERLAQETPSPEMYFNLFERLEREAEREEARRRMHARAWELAKQQGVEPVRRVEDLYGNFWPEEESIDDFLSWLRAERQEDKVRYIPE